MLPRSCPGRCAALFGGWILLSGVLVAQDVGYPGPSLAGAGPTIGNPSVTAARPESKLWFHDGSWWGSLWSADAQAFRIHRLAPGSHVWSDTGVAIEARPDSHSDALWNGTKLYIASHEFAQGAGGPGHPILLLRYGYANGAFVLDPGFPVTIGDSATESLVIDQDSQGVLWAAWKQGLRVRTAHSLGDDTSWSAPAILPGCTSDTTSDDICSLIAFGGDRIGVMWSDRALDTFFFAVHEDGAPDTTWLAVETALAGGADDHIDLAADSSGRVLAVVKDDTDDVHLLVRDGTGWQDSLVGPGSSNLTRPILLLDEPAGLVHVFAARQGAIRKKSARLDAPVFAPGTGTLVMRDADGTLNDPTSSKQNLRRITGLVVLAANVTPGGNYWHHEERGPAARLGLFAQGPTTNLPVRQVVLTASGASAGRWVRFVADSPAARPGSLRPGPHAHTLGLARADAAGLATLRIPVPPELSGTAWEVQALESGARRGSETAQLRL